MKSYRPVQPAFDAPASAVDTPAAFQDLAMHGNAFMNELLRGSGGCSPSELGPDSGGPSLPDWLRRETEGFAAGLGGCPRGDLGPDSGGQPLPDWVRREVEPGFGADLGGVGIHHDDAQARAHGANALTVGNDIVFGAGQFAPHTEDGRDRLEVADTLQQSPGLVDAGTGLRTSDPSGPSGLVFPGESLGVALGTVGKALGLDALFGLGATAPANQPPEPRPGEPPASIALPEQRPGEPPASIAAPDAPASDNEKPSLW